MALGDATNFTLENYGKKIIMEAAVDYTGSGTLSTTEVKLEVDFVPISGSGSAVTKAYSVKFSQYTNGVGVQVSGVQVTDITSGYKLNGFRIKELAANRDLIHISLSAAEQIEFPDGGILYIAQIALDAVGGLE